MPGRGASSVPSEPARSSCRGPHSWQQLYACPQARSPPPRYNTGRPSRPSPRYNTPGVAGRAAPGGAPICVRRTVRRNFLLCSLISSSSLLSAACTRTARAPRVARPRWSGGAARGAATPRSVRGASRGCAGSIEDLIALEFSWACFLQECALHATPRNLLLFDRAVGRRDRVTGLPNEIRTKCNRWRGRALRLSFLAVRGDRGQGHKRRNAVAPAPPPAQLAANGVQLHLRAWPRRQAGPGLAHGPHLCATACSHGQGSQGRMQEPPMGGHC
jgi:hypothetical protein